MSESRTKKSARNAIFTLFSRIVTLILGFVSRIIFLRFLSTEYLGLNGLFSNILTMLSFAEMGIGNVIQYSLYKPILQNNTEKIKKLMRFYKYAYRIIAVAVAVIGVSLFPFMDYIIEGRPDIPESLAVIYFLFIANSAVSYLFSYKQTMLQADQNAYVVSVFNSITAIAQNVIHIVVLFLTGNYIVYLISTIACTVLNNLLLARFVNKKYPYLKEKNVEKLDRTEKKRIFKDIKALSVSKIAGVACNGTDNIIITKILGLSSVGLVSNYTLIINTLSGFLYSLLSGFTGSVGNLNAEDNIEKRKAIFDQLFMASYFLYGGICACIIILINGFVGEVWLGKEYVVEIYTVIALVLIALQSGMNYTAYTFRTTLGYFNEVKYVYILTAIINIALSIWWGKWIGLAGVFYATIVSKLVTCEIADGYYAYKKGLEKSPYLYFVKYVGYMLIFAVSTVACMVAVKFIPLHGLLGFLVKGLVSFLLFNGINIAVFARTEAFKGLMSKALRLIKRKSKGGNIR